MFMYCLSVSKNKREGWTNEGMREDRLGKSKAIIWDSK